MGRWRGSCTCHAVNLSLKGLKLYEHLATSAPVRTRAGVVEEVQVVVFLGKVVVRKDWKVGAKGMPLVGPILEKREQKLLHSGG